MKKQSHQSLRMCMYALIGLALLLTACNRIIVKKRRYVTGYYIHLVPQPATPEKHDPYTGSTWVVTTDSTETIDTSSSAVQQPPRMDTTFRTWQDPPYTDTIIQPVKYVLASDTGVQKLAVPATTLVVRPGAIHH